MKTAKAISVILAILILIPSVFVGCRTDSGKDKETETESVTFKPGRYVREKATYYDCLDLSEEGVCRLTPVPPSKDPGYHIYFTKLEGNYLICGPMKFEIVDSGTLKYIHDEASGEVDPYLPDGSLFILEEK